MKLNPTKCSFKVGFGKFLGFLITRKGIEVTLDQIRAFKNMSELRTLRNIQKLIGRVVALNCFVSRLTDKCFPFFNLLKRNKKLIGMRSEEELLTNWKLICHFLQSLQNRNMRQKPMYYVSKTLLDAKTRYTIIEKLELALITAARKLRPYFQCHLICVVIAFLLRTILSKHNLLGRLVM